MAGVVKDVETFVVSVTAGNGSAGSPITDTLSLSQDLNDCVPFVTKRHVSGALNEVEHGQMDAWFSSTATLNVARDNTATNAYEVEVSVVQFDDTLCNIYSGTFQLSSGADGEGNTFDYFTIGATVDTSKSFLVFHSLQNSSGGEDYNTHLIRGQITDSAGDPGGTHVTMDRASADGTSDGHWYVVECIGTDFAVDIVDVSLSNVQTSNTGVIDIDTATTMLLGSWTCDTVANNNEPAYNTVDITFTDTVVTVQRTSADSALEWSGFAVDFADDTTVEHGTISAQGAVASQDVTLTTAVDDERSTAILIGNLGSTCGGSFPGTTSSSIADAQVQLTLRDSDAGGDFDEVRVRHSTGGGDASNDISWSVIQWGEGGAPPATRRVMIIS